MRGFTLIICGLFCAVPSFAGTYTDSYSYAIDQKNKDFINQYESAIDSVKSAFDEECGDSFCEGDYSNLVSVDLVCTVEQASGKIKQCLWTFAGTTGEIDEQTGKVQHTGKIFNCEFTPNATIDQLVKIWNSRDYDLFDTILPGMRLSLHDKLTTCLP